jgi:hypothetical protein
MENGLPSLSHEGQTLPPAQPGDSQERVSHKGKKGNGRNRFLSPPPAPPPSQVPTATHMRERKDFSLLLCGLRPAPRGEVRAVGVWGREKLERASGFASAREGASGARLCLAERGGLGGISAVAGGWLGARAPQKRSRGPRPRRQWWVVAGPPRGGWGGGSLGAGKTRAGIWLRQCPRGGLGGPRPRRQGWVVAGPPHQRKPATG